MNFAQMLQTGPTLKARPVPVLDEGLRAALPGGPEEVAAALHVDRSAASKRLLAAYNAGLIDRTTTYRGAIPKHNYFEKEPAP